MDVSYSSEGNPFNRASDLHLILPLKQLIHSVVLPEGCMMIFSGNYPLLSYLHHPNVNQSCVLFDKLLL